MYIGLSINELSNRTGVSKNDIELAESSNNPDKDVIIRLAASMNIFPDFFICDTD
jgi:transcriptional regulator with XRE-family HTH domain